MIIGVTFYGSSFAGNVYDTAIPTSEIDEVTLNTGMYDELYVTVDTSITKEDVKPTGWAIKNIMNAKFNNSLEAGAIDGSGHTVTGIQLYRRAYMVDNEWTLMAEFPYDPDYNVYTVVDRFIENGKSYEYAIVPIADKVIGDTTVSPPVNAKFDGTFISDIERNFKMEANLDFGEYTYNKNMNQSNPLNGSYPIVTFGNQNYRSGSVKFLPLTHEQMLGYANKIDTIAERLNREQIIGFLNNGQAKVIRNDNGDMIVCATSGVKTNQLSEKLPHLSNVSFDFVEIGTLDYETMDKAGLIAQAGRSLYTYDDFGEIVWSNQRINESARRKYRNSFAEVDK